MRFFFLLIGLSLLSFSCTNSQDGNILSSKIPKAIPSFQSLSDLPDSLQPKKIFLKDKPTPTSTRFHPSTSKSLFEQELPKLTNEEGEVILDRNGKSFIEGDGGISQFKNYTSDNNLALDAVNCGVLNSRGQLWFGTNGGGVSRFDGKDFTTFSTDEGLAGNIIRSIYEDSNGILWFGTLGGGISSFNGKVFTTYTSENGLGEGAIFAIMEDSKGNIWFGTGGGGVSKFDGESFTTLTEEDGLVNNGVISIAEDSKGAMWFGTNGGGVNKYAQGKFESFTTEDGLASNRVRSIFIDDSGFYWFGTIGGGLSRYDGMKFTTFSLQDGLASNVIRTVKQDLEGNIWLATDEGVSRFNGHTFKTYTSGEGLSSNNVLDILLDSNGGLWFCTDGGGISRFDGDSFTNFGMDQGLAGNIVLTILEDNDHQLWFGTAGGGLSHFDGNKFTTVNQEQGLAGEIVSSSMKDSSGRLWFGTGGGGVSLYDGETFTNYTSEQGLAGNDVYNIFEDSKSNIWFGTDGNGVSKFDGDGFTTYGSAQGLAGDVILGIAEDQQGNLWFGAADGGLSRFDGHTFISFNSEQGIADDAVIRVMKDSGGSLWIGTENGLSLLSTRRLELLGIISSEAEYRAIINDSTELFRNFTKADGLPNTNILQITEVPGEKIAIGTNLGITIFDGQYDHKSGVDSLRNIEVFNSETGFPVKDLTDGQNGLFVDSNGILWAGTGNNKTALVQFVLSHLPRNGKKPNLFFKQLRLNEEVIPWESLNNFPKEGEPYNSFVSTSDELITLGKKLTDEERLLFYEKFKGVSFDSATSFFSMPQHLVLPYAHNDINIDFGSDELAKPFLVEYQYILEGYDEHWSPVLKKTTANFGNIQEGTYTFKVKARYTGAAENGAGEWAQPISYTFEILPPVYRTWWAMLFYCLLFIFLLYPIYRFQQNRAIKAEKEKAKERELEQAREIEMAYKNLKATQAQLLHSEKMASIGELMSGIAHEIQNPLNFVNNFSEVTAELVEEIKEEKAKDKADRDEELENDLFEDIRSNLLKINTHGKRAGAIVKNMLQHSASGKGPKELTNINLLIEENLRISYQSFFARDSSLSVSYVTELDSEIPKIQVVPHDIGKVLLNLINNAFYEVNQKKKVLGEEFVASIVIRTIKITNQENKLGVRIEVKDNGNGIAKSLVEKVFQPFYTTKPTGQGTGLGLSLSYDIIKSHEGVLQVESTEGEGSTFIVELFDSSNQH